MERTRRRDRGGCRRCFTLLEIMVVLLIIGMVMGLVGPAVMKNVGKAQVRTAKAQVKLLHNACKDYYLDMSEYPRALDDLVTNPGKDKWDGPYLDPPTVPKDPWGEDYQYENPGRHGEIDVYSYGADRSSGGEGKNADITSWE